MNRIGIALALIVVACGNGKSDVTTTNVSPGLTSAGSSAQTIAVRLVGVRASGSVRVRVAALDLAVDGTALPVQLEGTEIDLGSVQSTGKVSAFTLPAEARTVAIKMRLEPDGVVERNGRALALDLSGPPLSLTVNASQLRSGNQVVLEVDLSRSVITQCNQVILMPEFMARF